MFDAYWWGDGAPVFLGTVKGADLEECMDAARALAPKSTSGLATVCLYRPGVEPRMAERDSTLRYLQTWGAASDAAWKKRNG